MKERTAATPGSLRDVLTGLQHGVFPTSAQVAHLHELLLGWYAAFRRDLPWRRTRDPYAIWVSEIMLQQTRVETVIPYYERFLARFPTAIALAEAASDDVLAAWSGLGYYRRARLLLEGARVVAASGGVVPGAREDLLGVPGIGKYTAGAIASIAFGQPVGLVDGNVARVLSRVFAMNEDMRKEGMRIAERLADAIVARQDPGAWNQALMELGATVCTPTSPACAVCPLGAVCSSREDGRVRERPVLSARATPTVQRVQSIVAVRAFDGGVLLCRRSKEQLFGGLWEPPSIDGPSRVRRQLVEWLPIGKCSRAVAIEHVLSHRRLKVDVVRAPLTASLGLSALPADGRYDGVEIVVPNRFDSFALSTLSRKVLAAAGVLEMPKSRGAR